MKTPRKIVVLLAGFTLAVALQQASAQIPGPITHTFAPGYSLFGNPLNAADNHLSSIIPTAPVGAQVMLWDTALAQYTPQATFNGTSWVGDFALAPRTGAVMYNPNATSFSTVFSGTILDADLTPYTGLPVHLPPPAPPLMGYYLVSSPISFSGSSFGGYSLFELIFGRLPEDETYFMKFNTASQDFTQVLIAAGGDWYNAEATAIVNPVLNVGEAGFFYRGDGAAPVFPPIIMPEPSSMALTGLGAASLLIFRRRNK